jgi:CheY-like chemotaxis protein
VIESALNLSGHEIRQRAQIVKHFEHVPEIHANATRLEQLFLNLLINAAHAVDGLDPQRNRIEISVRRAGDSHAVIAVRDNGVGMPPEVLRRVFDPFFTTKPTGVGTGLGLPICLGIVRALDGEIHLTSEVGVGTTATISLPLHTLPPPQPNNPPSPRQSKHKGRILVIDDERAVAESLAAALREEHDVVSVGSAREARGLLAVGQHFDVALCDLLMPEESGMLLYEHVQRERPELAARFIFMSGGAFLPEAERFLSRISNPRIDKPFEVAAVRRLVDQMLERGRGS